jgi:hypothetical protein
MIGSSRQQVCEVFGISKIVCRNRREYLLFPVLLQGSREMWTAASIGVNRFQKVRE